MRYRTFRVLIVAGVLVLMAMARGFAAEPDATVRITGKSIADGVGFSWGSGVLTYAGKEYPFSITGLSAGDRVTSVEFSGNVFNLKSLGDFNGNYTSFNAGVTLAGGGGGATMRNQNGVVMNVVATAPGLNFDFAIDGVKIELKK